MFKKQNVIRPNLMIIICNNIRILLPIITKSKSVTFTLESRQFSHTFWDVKKEICLLLCKLQNVHTYILMFFVQLATSNGKIDPVHSYDSTIRNKTLKLYM